MSSLAIPMFYLLLKIFLYLINFKQGAVFIHIEEAFSFFKLHRVQPIWWKKSLIKPITVVWVIGMSSYIYLYIVILLKKLQIHQILVINNTIIINISSLSQCGILCRCWTTSRRCWSPSSPSYKSTQFSIYPKYCCFVQC